MVMNFRRTGPVVKREEENAKARRREGNAKEDS
jgi:hypothetical protein